MTCYFFDFLLRSENFKNSFSLFNYSPFLFPSYTFTLPSTLLPSLFHPLPVPLIIVLDNLSSSPSLHSYPPFYTLSLSILLVLAIQAFLSCRLYLLSIYPLTLLPSNYPSSSSRLPFLHSSSFYPPINPLLSFSLTSFLILSLSILPSLILLLILNLLSSLRPSLLPHPSYTLYTQSPPKPTCPTLLPILSPSNPGIPLLQTLSRAPNEKPSGRNSAEFFSDDHESGIFITGRLVLNAWKRMKSEMKLQSYTKHFVAQQLLNRKVMNGGEINPFFYHHFHPVPSYLLSSFFSYLLIFLLSSLFLFSIFFSSTLFVSSPSSLISSICPYLTPHQTSPPLTLPHPSTSLLSPLYTTPYHLTSTLFPSPLVFSPQLYDN